MVSINVCTGSVNLTSKDATDKSFASATILSFVVCLIVSPEIVSFSIASLNNKDKKITPNSGLSASSPPKADISLNNEPKFLCTKVA